MHTYTQNLQTATRKQQQQCFERDIEQNRYLIKAQKYQQSTGLRTFSDKTIDRYSMRLSQRRKIGLRTKLTDHDDDVIIIKKDEENLFRQI